MGQSGDSQIRHFLVQRRFGKLESIRVYDDAEEALRAYEQQERENGWVRHALTDGVEADCVLLGADRLATCIATHGNWFDEPSDFERALAEAMTTEDDVAQDTRPGGWPDGVDVGYDKP